MPQAGGPTFAEVLSAAVADLIEHGYDSAERVANWIEMLREAALRSMVPLATVEESLIAALKTTYRSKVENGGMLRMHPGVSRFTLERVKPQLRAELDRRILTAADLIVLNRKKTIEDTLQRFSGWATSIPPGGTKAPGVKREAKDAVRKSVASLSFRERRVVIDQSSKMASNLSEILAVDGGALAGIWDHTGAHRPGYHPRPEHVARDGKLFVVRDNWALSQGLMRLTGHQYTDEIERPGELIYCLPGNSPIEFAEFITVGYRRWYNGELTELVTDSGKSIRATPNHPILTPEGWCPIGSLNEGDSVVQVAEQFVQAPEVDANHRRAPMIQQIFSALSEHGSRVFQAGTRKDFHGDGTNGNVDIVFATRALTVDLISSRNQCARDVGFSDAVNTALRGGASFESDDGVLLAAARGVRGYDLTFAGALVEARVTKSAGLLPISDWQPKFSQSGGDNISGYMASPRDGEHAFPFLVSLANIINVNRRPWSGHVFNLQTELGYYTANGLIVHNCSCKYIWLHSLSRLPPDMLTAAGREAIMRARAA